MQGGEENMVRLGELNDGAALEVARGEVVRCARRRHPK